MRTGGYTVQQTLTTEAASVLKQSLTLARRRGHAQVTPLHVAATLLSSRTSLLRRACIKSHPGFSTNYQFAPSHQCRALELCFNVALNRLPTVPNPMFHGHPSLANALVAALKRAQAHQRRGCIEQQQQQHQTQLLAIKVELEQLVISILDDPSVSRVMREAGFNSTSVKNSLEDCSVSSVDVSSQQKQHHSRFHHYQNPKDFNFINPNFGFWQTHFLNQSLDQNPLLISSSHPQQRLKEIDLKLVIDVLLKKKTKKKNPVLIVGDSASFTEGLISELMTKVEREEIMDLKKTHFVKFQFSPMVSKFMRREDVETNIKELRKKVVSLTLNGKDVIIFTGDLKWTIREFSNNNGQTNEISSSNYSPLDHLVEEIGKLLAEYNSEDLNDDDDSKIRRVWVMGTASFQTYMRCQMRQPSLETLWALHPLSVPSSPNLALSLHATSGDEARNMSNVNVTKPFFGYNQAEKEKSVLSCCPECVSSFEREAKVLKANHEKLLPTWLQSHDGDYSSHKDELMGLGRKWNMFCENLHNKTGQFGLMGKNYSYGSSNELSRSTSLSVKQNSIAKFRRQNSCTIEFDLGGNEYEKGVSIINETEAENENVETTLDLGFQSDSGTETRKKINGLVKALEKCVPRQHAVTIPLIAKSLIDSVLKKKDSWIMIEGNDAAAKRSIARTVSEYVFGSLECLVNIDLKKKGSSSEKLLAYGLENQEKVVFLIEDIDLADSRFLKLLADRFEENWRTETGNERQAIFILTKDDSYSAKNRDSVLQIGLEINGGRKRKPESDLSVKEGKRFKVDNELWMKSSFNSTYLDLNIKAEEEEGDKEESPISSDLTGEEESEITSKEFVNRIQNRFVLNRSSEGVRFSVEEISGGKVENGAFQSWVKEVF